MKPRAGRALARQLRSLPRPNATFGTGGASDLNERFGPANNAASYTRRTMRGWNPWTARNPDDEVVLDRQELVARSRDAYRNQGIARSAVNTMLTSTVGGGLEMHCRIDGKFLGISDTEKEAWEKNTERLFRLWAKSTDADARRRRTFYRLQNIAYKNAKHSGEIFALLPIIPRPKTICDLRVQLVEGDRVSTPFDLINGPLVSQEKAPSGAKGSIWDGIETGPWGEPVAYHIETTVPMPFAEFDRKWKRVLAFGASSGRQQVIHFYEEDRPGQRRGLPFLSPILEMLKQIARYSDAELMAAVISAMFTVFIKHDDPEADVLGGLPSGAVEGVFGRPDGDGGDIGLGNGAVVDLMKGESIETANPGRPNQQFGPFILEIVKQIGMALSIPYEVLTKHFASSYSASRAAIMQAWEVFNTEREWFVQEFCQPIYSEWLAQMISTGKIVAPGFFDDVEVMRAYAQSQWYGPVPIALDPVKEAKAATERMQTLVTTLAEETERYSGADWEQNLAQRARENAAIKSFGLVEETPLPTQQDPIFPE